MNKRRIPIFLAHGLVVATSVATICASLGVIAYTIARPEGAEDRLSGHRPTYFRGQLSAGLLDDYGPVFAVGHNSGASFATTREALASGADVIEIDVASMGNQLVSAHMPPSALYGRQVFRGPTLEAVWRASAAADVIQLDLKESTSAFRKQVLAFLEEHAGERTVMVATSDVVMLRLLEERVPAVLRFLSVPDRMRVQSLYEDDDLLALIDGVTIRYQLVTAESVARLKIFGLIVIAWTVNDLGRVNDFVALGVDGISTDNLAIMGVLGESQVGERLATYRLAPDTEHQAAFEDVDELAQEATG